MLQPGRGAGICGEALLLMLQLEDQGAKVQAPAAAASDTETGL